MSEAQDSADVGAAVAIFRHREQSEATIHHLHAHGFRFGDIGAAGLGPEALAVTGTGAAVAPAAADAATGVLAKLATWLVGMGPISVPGLGSVIAAGPLGAGLRGALPGVAPADLLATLTAMGLPEVKARLAGDAIKTGSVLVAVSAGPRLAEARSVLRSEGGELLGDSDSEMPAAVVPSETRAAGTGSDGARDSVEGARGEGQSETRLDRIRVGSRVYSADGQELGMVDGLTGNRIRVDRLQLHGTLYVPTDAIDRVEHDRVTLRVPSQDIGHAGWEETRRKETVTVRQTTREMVRGVAEAQPPEVLGGILSFLENIPASAYFLGMAGSILASLGLFISGRRHTALFVGLWVPSIVSTALFYKLLRPSREVHETLGQRR